MSQLALRVNNLGKQYRLGVQDTHRTLRDVMVSAVKRPLDRLRGRSQPQPTSFWALHDVSFEVKRGEVVGIIGRNGAGKSTLLKILARITEPTTGRVEGYGRVGSLLEVGTGFHPELSGRENIYLNGAILGMKQAEIVHKFDEIVAFAEIEKFLDTAVKHYSSGMYMRLAFAVAAHLEPEILIVDEVLAVGDAEFQKKCLGKMGEIAKEGRTVLFVSHNMGAIQMLCQRAILLGGGSVQFDNTVASVVASYLQMLENGATQDLQMRTERRGKGLVRIIGLEISVDHGFPKNHLMVGRLARFIFHINTTVPNLSCSFTIYDALGQAVTYFDSAIHSQADLIEQHGEAKFECRIDELPLMPGRYRLNAAVMSDGEMQDHLEGAAFFEVSSGNFQGRVMSSQSGYGHIFIPHQWITTK